MKDHPTILLVDDDASIRRLVQLYLEKEGYTVRTADRGDDALAEFRHLPPDLMLLDVMLPGLDGLQVLTQVRKTSQIPVIMLTAKDETFDKVIGLGLGADDYITKPFDSKELVARVKAVLRRSGGAEDEHEEKELSFPGLTVSLSKYEVHYEGQKVEMPPKELEVLYFLASHPGQVFTRDQLLEQVWGFDFPGESSRTVDVHIKRVRDKLPGCEKYGWRVMTVWGVGYKFEVEG
ncbi:MAG: response regulator transcription factor [Clostridia bacterium]|nr:response regulator transcription factor [Clostridia bacterium]